MKAHVALVVAGGALAAVAGIGGWWVGTREPAPAPRVATPPPVREHVRPAGRVACPLDDGVLAAVGDGEIEGLREGGDAVVELPPGEWFVWWRRDGRDDVALGPVVVYAGQERRCRVGTPLLVSVLDPAGRIAAGARVSGCGLDEVADADGRLVLRVPAAACALRAALPEGEAGTPVSFGPFDAPAQVTLVAPPVPVAPVEVEGVDSGEDTGDGGGVEVGDTGVTWLVETGGDTGAVGSDTGAVGSDTGFTPLDTGGVAPIYDPLRGPDGGPPAPVRVEWWDAP